MSNFKNLQNKKCVPPSPSPDNSGAKKCISVQENIKTEWIEDPSPYYSDADKRYYIKQSKTKDGEIVKSADANRENIDSIRDQVIEAGKEKIFNYFNFDLSETQKNEIKGYIKDYKVHKQPNKSVDFLVYIESSDLLYNTKQAKPVDIPSDERISIDVSLFFEGIQGILGQVKIFSRYQSYMHTFDKLKLTKENGQPFYLSFIANRLEKLEKKMKNFLIQNDFSIDAAGKLVFFFDNSGGKRIITNISIDNTENMSYETVLTVGIDDFLDSPFFKDEDVMELLYKFNQVAGALNATNSWVDTIVDTFAGVQLTNLSLPGLSAIPCFENFNFLNDAILDDALTFFEKLEYSFHKKNSVKIADVISPPAIFDSGDIGFNTESVLGDIFKNAKFEVPKFSDFNPDDIRRLITEAAEKFSESVDDFQNIYQFLSPQAMSQILNSILENLKGALNPEDLMEIMFQKAKELLSLKKMEEIINFLPANIKDQIEEIVSAFDFPLSIPDFAKGFLEDLFKNIPNILDGIGLPKDIDQIEFPNEKQEMVKFPKINFDKLRVIDFAEVINFIVKNFPSIQLPSFEEIAENFANLREDLAKTIPPGDIFSDNDYESFSNENKKISIPFEFPAIDFRNMERALNTDEIVAFLKLMYHSFIDKVGELKKVFDSLTKNPLNILKIGPDVPTDVPEELKDLNIDIDIESFFRDMYGNILDEVLSVQDKFDLFDNIPEFQNIADWINKLSIPGVNFDPVKHLQALGNKIPMFDEKLFKLPEIPEMPEINFNIIQVLRDNLQFLLEKVIKKIVALIISKVVSMLKNDIKDGIANGFPQSSTGEVNFTDGLGSFVSQHLCGDDPEDLSIDAEISDANNKDPSEATDALLKNIVSDDSISDAAYQNLAMVIGVSSNIADVINLVCDDEVNEEFAENLTDIIQTSAPEFSDYFKDTTDTKGSFRKVRDFLKPETVQELKNYKNNFSGTVNAEENFCIPKSRQQQWIAQRGLALQEQGFDREAADKFVQDELDKIKEHTSDVMDLLTGSSTGESFFADAIDNVISNALSETGPDDSCDDNFKSVAVKEQIQQEKKKLKQASDSSLEKINFVFTDDLLNDELLPFQEDKGMLSQLMADKYGTSMNTATFYKTNLLTIILMNFGVIPKPEFAGTIGQDLTREGESGGIDDGFDYNSQTGQRTLQVSNVKKLFLNFLPNVKMFVEEKKLKKPDVTLSYENGIDIEYVDHNNNSLEYYVVVGDSSIVSSGTKFPQDVLEQYPNLENLNKNQFLSQIIDNFGTTEYNDINEDLFKGPFYDSLKIGKDIKFGYPEETNKNHLDALQDAFKESGTQILSEVQNLTDINAADFSHVTILDPELYGSFFGTPKFHIKEGDLPNGFLKNSKDFYDKKTSNKLDKSILNLQSVSEYIDNYKQKIKVDKFMKNKPEDLADRPFMKVHNKDLLARAQGAVRIYIRTFIAEYMILANNVFTQLGFDVDVSLLSNYIMEKIKQENSFIRLPGPDMYSQFITYVMMLQSNAQDIVITKDTQLSKQLNDINNDYVPLTKEDIKSVKNKTLTKENARYKNYIKGFYAIAFGDKYQGVYNSSPTMPVQSGAMTSNEIKFADKLGYSLNHIDTLEEALAATIAEEIEFYKNKYPSSINIYTNFVKYLTQDTAFGSFDPPDGSGFETQKHYVLVDNNGNRVFHSKDSLISELQNVTNKDVPISAVFGDAAVAGDTYTGTIGIQYGVTLYYNGQIVSSFVEDLEDVTIDELLNGSGLEVDHDCHVREFFKTVESRIFFDLTFQIKKIPTIVAIHYIENIMSSVGKGTDESAIFLSPFAALGGLADALEDATEAFSLSARKPNLLVTKKEIRELFLSSYIREFYDPEREESEGFFDFKSFEIFKGSVDTKNLGVSLLSGPSPFQRLRMVDKIPTDENGDPIVNKFLSSFK